MNALMVPLHLDALRLAVPRRVLGPLARVDRLPWSNGHRVYNPDRPWLGQALEAPPFAEPDSVLDAGVHLHWTLPDGLTRGVAGADFPPLPDRWYVRRIGPREAAWVVESDFTEPGALTVARGRTLFPAVPENGRPPWRVQGRCLSFDDWLLAVDGPRSPPTAMGYGEPLFAAFYPGCRGLFGLHDSDPPAGELTYDVIGWYSRGAEDPLTAGLTAQDLLARFHWVVPDGPVPGRLACYGRLTVAASAPARALPAPRVALAASGGSALAAFCAEAAPAGRGEEVEAAVATLTHAGELLHLDTDHGAVRATLAHEAGFVAEPGGICWGLRPHDAPDDQGAKARPDKLRDSPPPPTLAAHLDRLNAAQAAHDAAVRRLQGRREQLLADWSKLMLLLYPQKDETTPALDPSQVQDFLRRSGIEAIAREEALLGTVDLPTDRDDVLKIPFDTQGHLQRAPVAGRTLADRVTGAAGRALRKLAVYNATALSGRRNGEPLLEVDTRTGRGHLAFDGTTALVLDQIEGWGSRPWLGEGRSLAAFTLRIRLRAEAAGTVLSIGDHLQLVLDATLVPVLILGEEDPGLAASRPLPRGKWTELVASYDGTTGRRRLWLDTAAAGENTLADPPMPGLLGPRRWPVLGAPSAGEPFEEAAGRDGRFRGAVARLILLPDQALGQQEATDLVARFHPPTLALARQTAARFWRSRDPVVALKGPAARASGRHSRGDLPAHPIADPALAGLDRADRVGQARALPVLTAKLAAIAAAHPGDAGLHSGTGAPWHPIALEWETALHPLAVPPGTRASDRLTGAYRLEADGPELEPRPGVYPLWDRVSVSRGRAILTPFAARLLQERRTAAQRNGLDTDALPPQALADHADTQSQALGGFHGALLQHRQALALPPDDPLALPAGDERQATRRRGFSRETIREALGLTPGGPTLTLSAALPDLPFVPLRAGRLELRRLRLIDAFGQVLEVPAAAPARARELARGAAGPGAAMSLPPRLAQPARLAFRWLAADTGLVQANDHPASSPLCGWVMASYLDDALAVYAADGTALGEVAPGAPRNWMPAPGGRPIPPERFDNAVLGRLVQALALQDGERSQALLAAIARSLDHILPSLDAAPGALSLIAGRPLAVVRARLRLELRGPAAIDQSWHALTRDLRRERRDDGGISALEVPVRLGERGRLEDGLVGFWREDAGGLPSGPFHAPALRGDDLTGPGIVAGDDPGFPLRLQPDGAAETVTLLIDPFGKVHATSGILPVKAIDLPAIHYAEALGAIETWALAAPVLGPRGRRSVPLPALAGCTWGWRERTTDGWQNLPAGALTPPRTDAAFDGPIQAREGWLILTRKPRP